MRGDILKKGYTKLKIINFFMMKLIVVLISATSLIILISKLSNSDAYFRNEKNAPTIINKVIAQVVTGQAITVYLEPAQVTTGQAVTVDFVPTQ
jgi:hypothetical protein